MTEITDDENEIEQFGWAVWLNDGSGDECAAVLASDEETAIEFAIVETGIEPKSDEHIHVDGPYQNAEPAYYEFEYITEHRERVIVEAPYEDYAKEMADAERNYSGEYVQTVRTERNQQPKDTSQYREHHDDGPNYEKERRISRQLDEFR